MKAKSIIIVIISVLVTIILMKNTDEVKFWIFSEIWVSKLAVMGAFFALGLLVGLLLRRSRKKAIAAAAENDVEEDEQVPLKKMSDDDRDYIS